MNNCLQKALSVSVALLVSVGGATFAADFEAAKGTPIGARVDSFRLTDHQGKEWTIEDFRGKRATVYAFIGTQCPLAKMYSTKLVAIEKQYRDRGVSVVAVDSNIQDSLAEMSVHARKFEFSFAFLKDPAQQLANQMGATRTPDRKSVV